MNYPEQFTTNARNAVEREKVLANQAFKQCFNGCRRKWSAEIQRETGAPDSEIANCARVYVMRVVLAFATQACELGKCGAWSAAEIDAEVHEFIGQVAMEADREKRFDHYGTILKTFRFFDPGSRTISDDELHKLKLLSDWDKYQDALLGLTEIADDSTTDSLQPKPADMASIRDQLDAAALADGINHDVQADRIGISRSNYYEVKAGRGGKKARTKTTAYLELRSKAPDTSGLGPS